MHLLREETQCALETITTEPAQSLLSAVGKKDSPEGQPKKGNNVVVRGVHEFVKHGCPPL
jgi:hypothetical protein